MSFFDRLPGKDALLSGHHGYDVGGNEEPHVPPYGAESFRSRDEWESSYPTIPPTAPARPYKAGRLKSCGAQPVCSFSERSY